MTTNSVNTVNPIIQQLSSNITSVITCNTAIPYDDTIPQNTEGTEVATLSITPVYNDSILKITFYCSVTKDANGGYINIALFQDATVGALAAHGYKSDSTDGYDVGISHTMTSGTTSSTTFKIRIGSAADSCYLNGDTSGNRLMGGVANARLIIKEYI